MYSEEIDIRLHRACQEPLLRRLPERCPIAGSVTDLGHSTRPVLRSDLRCDLRKEKL